jgi:hypothetical protein
MKRLTGIGHEVFIELAAVELSHKLTQVRGDFLLHLLFLFRRRHELARLLTLHNLVLFLK